ncbi:hypothetical protein AHiyo6_04320, partial [Arthrobacter sp. Hiyo6]
SDNHAQGAPAPSRSTGERAAGTFPAFARTGNDETDEYDDDEPSEREPRSMRWLVGGLLAAVLVVGLILAITNLGSLFKSVPQANPNPSGSSSAAPAPTSAQASPNQARRWQDRLPSREFPAWATSTSQPLTTPI